MVFAEGTGDGGSDRVHVVTDPGGDDLATWHCRIRDQEPKILGRSDLVVVPSLFGTGTAEDFLWWVHVITGWWRAWWCRPGADLNFFFFLDWDE